MADVIAGDELPPLGRARRFACDDRTLWRLPAEDEAVLARIVALRVGAVVASGVDEEGPWLVRAAASPTLGDVLGSTPVPWRRAVAMIASLVETCAACEAAAVYPGPIDPAHLLVAGDALRVPADALVAALVGAPAVEASAGSAGARWLAPEQVAGARGDNAANRYAIGLVMYRLLAGEHPFAGAGLRRGLDEQAGRGAPPFADEVAATLPPGLQSLCLRLLDPDPARRPQRASEIADALRGMRTTTDTGSDSVTGSGSDSVTGSDSGTGSGSDSGTGSGSGSVTGSGSGSGSGTGSVRTRAWTSILRAALSIAIIAAAIAVAFAIASSKRAAGARRIGAETRTAELAAPRATAECATCHPRHASEWSRSVMAHAGTSPLFLSLEMLIEEQFGKDRDCPHGAGVLRTAGPGACRDRGTGLPVTGAGGANWCVNCHAPGENLGKTLPAWDARAASDATRRPLTDLLPATSLEGISCVACHQMTGPVRPGNEARGLYEGNPSWISPFTGVRHAMRPEDARGRHGIANSGYLLSPGALLAAGEPVAGGAHRRPAAATKAYLRSSEMCGACHDVRLFGTDALGGVDRGESFKRLRNAYSEWLAWTEQELRAGREPASCQDCHMSLFPAVCEPGPSVDSLAGRACPPGTRPRAVPPGARAPGAHATSDAAALQAFSQHYFSGVDLPLGDDFDPAALDDPTLDVAGVPVGLRRRRDLLLASTFRFALEPPTRRGGALEVPVVIENVGAGHRVPAGFSQEREIWVHLRVTDARGDLVYEVGRVDRPDEDLRDKRFLRVTTTDTSVDRQGRPLGLFGADVADGPDVPRWTPVPATDGAEQRGRGLVNFQNGFLRCVACIGTIDADGVCQPGPGQSARRADRFVDGDYDPDTGACRSNLRGENAFLEIYFPVGALDATRGVLRGPDAIVDTRSLPPRAPRRYTFELDARGAPGPYTVEARLLFRAFPPYLVRAFADYEREQARRGRRPSGPLVDTAALQRLDIVEIAAARAVIP